MCGCNADASSFTRQEDPLAILARASGIVWNRKVQSLPIALHRPHAAHSESETALILLHYACDGLGLVGRTERAKSKETKRTEKQKERLKRRVRMKMRKRRNKIGKRSVAATNVLCFRLSSNLSHLLQKDSVTVWTLSNWNAFNAAQKCTKYISRVTLKAAAISQCAP